LSGFTIFAGCGAQSMPTAATPVKVKTDEVKSQDFSGELALTGIIDVQKKSNLSAQLPGIVMAVRAKEGTFVKKGDFIISLDKKYLLNQLEQAKAGLANNQALADSVKVKE